MISIDQTFLTDLKTNLESTVVELHCFDKGIQSFIKELSLRSDGRFEWNSIFEPHFHPDVCQICLYGTFCHQLSDKINCLIAGSCDFH